MKKELHEYEVAVHRKNGDIYMYTFLDAESCSHALMEVKDNPMLQEMLKNGELEPFEHWKVKDLTELRKEERLKENPQLSLF